VYRYWVRVLERTKIRKKLFELVWGDRRGQGPEIIVYWNPIKFKTKNHQCQKIILIRIIIKSMIINILNKYYFIMIF